MDRSLPADISAERAVLGSCLLDRDAIIAIRYALAETDFYLETHGWVYAAILACLNDNVPPDLVTVSDELQRGNRLEPIGGVAFLVDLTVEVPTAVHVEYYAEIVARHAARRRFIEMSGELAAAGYAYDDTDRLISEMARRLDLMRRTSETRDRWLAVAADGAARWHEKHQPVQFTIDQVLPEGTFLLTGKPKTAKSWLALNYAYAVANKGKAFGHFQALVQGEVLYIDLEMGPRRIWQRLHTLFPDNPPPRGVNFATEWPRVGQGFAEWITDYMEKRPATRLIIVDTLVGIRPPRNRSDDSYEQDKSFAQTVTDVCHRYSGLSMFLIHHSRKQVGADPIDDASGTTGLSGGMDNYGSLSRNEEIRGGGVLKFAGRDHLLDHIAMYWDEYLVQWTYDAEATATASGKLSKERREVLQLLGKHSSGLVAKQIAELMGKPYDSTRRLLSDMLKDRQIGNSQGIYFSREDDEPQAPLIA